MELNTWVEIAYLVSAVLFVVGLKRMQSPATAVAGNRLAAAAMLIAIVATFAEHRVVSWAAVLGGLVVGSLVGAASARLVKMTAMPEMVGLFNGLGGAASALVAAAEILRLQEAGGGVTVIEGSTIALTMLIGAVTFSGSMIAFGKLAGWMTGNPITFPLQKSVNALIFLAIVGLGVAIALDAPVGGLGPVAVFWILTGLSLLLGVLLVIPIGGADMPVVISLLNSYSGMAGSAAGFVIGNMVLIISGALVGSAGLILTQIMCKAMNRSLANVAFGAFGGTATQAKTLGKQAARSVDAEQAAMLLAYAGNVVVVPGYGLAVSQAQHELRKVMDMLEEKGVDVKYAIHPVAGRMPGHMNVLLAEADVPYDKLYDLDQINDDFARTDVVVVVGANDVVNPEARNPQSVIAGMPILDVDKAKNVIVVKRSLSPGFAGIDNPLFYMDNTRMYFADAKQALADIAKEVKEA
jgi:NAD(P) transhydrogenase subunit beta